MKKLVKKYAVAAILAVLWIVLGIVQTKVSENLPMQVLNFLTFAQGGLYGGILGAVGGFLGKVVFAACISALVTAIIQKRNPLSSLADGFKTLIPAFQGGKPAIASLLKGAGLGLLVYAIFNLTQSWENSMVGVVSAGALVLAAGRKSGWLWKKLGPGMLAGLVPGFLVGVALSAIGFAWCGPIGLVFLIAGWILGRGSRKEAAASILLAVFFLAAQPSADAKGKGWVLVGKDVKASTTSIHHVDDRLYDSWVTDVTNIQTTDYGFSFDVVTVHTKKAHNEVDTRPGTYTCSFDPFADSYQPGERYDGNHRWKREGNFEPKMRVVGIIDTNSGEQDEHFLGPSIEMKGFAYADFTFPPKEKVNGDILVVQFKATIYEEENIIFTYTFQWNGKGGGAAKADKVKEDKPKKVEDIEDDDLELEEQEWLNILLGADGEHTSDIVTILIALAGAGGGAAGAGLGGLLGGSLPEGGPDGPTPEEQEWARWQKEADDRRKRYVVNNSDGTKTYVDPATGERHTLYPKQFDPETGEAVGWENENDSAYTTESLDEWLAWRERNSGTFAQDAAEARQSVEDQRAANRARNEADRARGSSEAADAHKAVKKQIEDDLSYETRLRDIAMKYGLPDTDKESLTKGLLKERHKALEEGAEAMHDAAFWNDAANGAEFVEQTSDTLINVLGETSPAARKIKNAYTGAKTALKRGAERTAKGEGLAGVAKGIAHGAVEGGIGILQNEGKTGIGGEVAKSVLNDLMEGKSTTEILENAGNAAIDRWGYDRVGDIVGKYGDKALEGSKQFGPLAQELGVHKPLTKAVKLHGPDLERYTTHMSLKERSAMLAADDFDDFPENE
ncbi:MAG: MFS transporter [Bacteroidales bacterium]|nr:MFS transporter [Bacteroidales bacterium]